MLARIYMVMSAKTPGLLSEQRHSGRARNRHQYLAMFPPLLVNVGPRASLMDYTDQNYESSLLFGPGDAMFLPADSSNTVQPPQPLNQLQGLQAPLSIVATSSSLVFQLQSLSSAVNSDGVPQHSTTLPLSTTSALSTDASPQSPISSLPPTALTETSSTASTSQTQTQTLSESQTQAGFVTASASAAPSIGVTSATTSVLCISLNLNLSNPSSLHYYQSFIYPPFYHHLAGSLLPIVHLYAST